MITRRFVLGGLIAAPAVIAADKLMPVHSLPQRYATVWGVGHDLEVVEHVIWEPISVAGFGASDAIDKFREVTAWEYGFPVKPMPKPATWRIAPTPDPLSRFRNPERIAGTPFWPAGYTPSTMYALAEDMGPSARVGIWDPDRAKKDDMATGGYNLHKRNVDEAEDACYQLWFDEAHRYNARMLELYPVTGMPPDEAGWKALGPRPRLGPETGWKITIKTAIV